MEFKVTEKKDNPLLERTEVKLVASFSGATPGFGKIRAELIKFLKSDKNLTVLNGLKQEFGAHEISYYAKVYKNAEAMKVEPKHRLKKNFEAVAEEKTEEAAQEKEPSVPEEKPAEEAAVKSEEKHADEESLKADEEESAAKSDSKPEEGE